MRVDDRPLSALLSQVLVAFTVEFDNEFERRMREAGHAGARLSLVLWANLMRFLVDGCLSVRELAARALEPDKSAKFGLGCMERWGFVTLAPDAAQKEAVPARMHPRAGRVLRDGWGSGRGIRSGWRVHLTAKGRTACEIWRGLSAEIEGRWEKRFGVDEIGALRKALEDAVEQLDLELPEGFPAYREGGEKYPARATRPEELPLAALLAQLLLAFTMEFEQGSRVSLFLCANTLRILGEQPIPEADIPRLTGGSPETSGIGWQIKPFIVVERGPAGTRGKVVRLSPLGLRAQQVYRSLTAEIEKRWEKRFGSAKIARLRDALRELFVPRREDRLLIAEGLIPFEGTARAGEQAPALGRRDVGPAAQQRMRDLVAQTKAFVNDPVHALPHYPLWDMNRGFGP